MKQGLKLITIGCILIFWGLVICCVVLTSLWKKENEINKKSIIAGYQEGSIIHYELMIYEDSTYYLSTVNSMRGYESSNRWKISKDTLLLELDDKVCAKILGTELLGYYDSRFRCLSIMEIRAFDPPKIVSFPK